MCEINREDLGNIPSHVPPQLLAYFFIECTVAHEVGMKYLVPAFIVANKSHKFI